MRENSTSSTTSIQLENQISDTSKRRLAPQFSFKPDNNSEQPKGKTVITDSQKKPVVRYTREQMVAMRKSSTLLRTMACHADIIMDSSQDPVCFQALEPEDVVGVWHAASKDAKAKGKPKSNKDDDEERNDERDLWNDVNEDPSTFDGSTFDFSKIAEESSRFRSELDRMKNGNDDKMSSLFDGIKNIEEDAMEALFRDAEIENKRMDDSAKPQFDQTTKVNFGSLLLGNERSGHRDDKLNEILPGNFVDHTVSGSFSSSLHQAPTTVNEPINNAAPIRVETVAPSSSSFATAEWFYKDPQGNVQGPFSQQNMQLWHKDGYFTTDLPVKLREWSSFHPFIDVYPNQSEAFVGLTLPPVSTAKQVEVSTPINVFENTVVPIQSSSIVTSIAPETKKNVEVDNASMNRKVHTQVISGSLGSEPLDAVTSNTAVTNTHSSNKSAMAKKILGISGNLDTKETATLPLTTAAVKAPIDITISKKEVQSAKGWKKPDSNSVDKKALLDIQKEQLVPPRDEAISDSSGNDKGNASVQLKSVLGIFQSAKLPTLVRSNNVTESVSVSQPKPTVAWSAANGAETKPLKDIMEEELTLKKDDTQGETRPVGNSWASKAKGLNSSLPSVKLETKSIVPDSSKVGVKPQPTVVQSTKPASTLPMQGSVAKSDFGGKQLSKEMSEWCSSQLRKIHGSDDLTLIEFCMTLNSSVDIRETFSQVLGSSAQVTNFATEFIRYKDEGKRPVMPSAEATAIGNDAKHVKPHNAGNAGFTSIKKKKNVK